MRRDELKRNSRISKWYGAWGTKERVARKLRIKRKKDTTTDGEKMREKKRKFCAAAHVNNAKWLMLSVGSGCARVRVHESARPCVCLCVTRKMALIKILSDFEPQNANI